MRKTITTLMLITLFSLPALASTRSIQGIVTEVGDKTLTVQVLWYALGTFPQQTWKVNRLTKEVAYHVDGKTTDAASFWSALKVGSRVMIIDGSRGTYYLDVLSEKHLPVLSRGRRLADGHLVIDLPQAVSVSMWCRRETAEADWRFKPGDLRIHVSADGQRAFGIIQNAIANAVEVDVSRLKLTDEGISGELTATLTPYYQGEKQEKRVYTFALNGTLSEGALKGTWSSKEAKGELTGEIEVTEPIGGDRLLWVGVGRGLRVGHPEQVNTLVVPFKDGVVDRDGVAILHYKGFATPGPCESANVEIKDGKVSGRLVYGGETVEIRGDIIGSHVALHCKGGAPLVESYAAGRLWPVHPLVSDMAPFPKKGK